MSNKSRGSRPEVRGGLMAECVRRLTRAGRNFRKEVIKQETVQGKLRKDIYLEKLGKI